MKTGMKYEPVSKLLHLYIEKKTVFSFSQCIICFLLTPIIDYKICHLHIVNLFSENLI